MMPKGNSKITTLRAYECVLEMIGEGKGGELREEINLQVLR